MPTLQSYTDDASKCLPEQPIGLLIVSLTYIEVGGISTAATTEARYTFQRLSEYVHSSK